MQFLKLKVQLLKTDIFSNLRFQLIHFHIHLEKIKDGTLMFLEFLHLMELFTEVKANMIGQILVGSVK